VRRRTLVAGNWKMNLRRGDAESYCAALEAAGAGSLGPQVVLFPPFPLLSVVAAGLGNTGVEWGGQDLHAEREGAHTGDVSGLHLLDWDSRWVLCGHSERRQDHEESDELVAWKIRAAIDVGLEPLLCVGETLQQREAESTHEVLLRQLRVAWSTTRPLRVLAYEPLWAIGTGLTATPEQAQEAHSFLRHSVGVIGGSEVASALRIVYGGSVKPGNCEPLLAQADVDGFLIGGASLASDTFLDIIRRCDASIEAPGG
jgi:triosephosphate isomerase